MKQISSVFLFAILAFSLHGCSFGNAPEGMNSDDVRSAFEKMTPEQKISFIKSSPMPATEKDRRIKDIQNGGSGK